MRALLAHLTVAGSGKFAMDISPIKTERDYGRTLKEIEGLMTTGRGTAGFEPAIVGLLARRQAALAAAAAMAAGS
ncbi:MAG: hypothetical protein J4F33_02410 [Alphaproteobacteria bacterium]|nr:hypothetical protein [Alphaproteobacteria bacterium]